MSAFVAFTIVREHERQIPVQRYVALVHAEAMCLRCVCVVLEALLAWLGVAWRSSSVAFLLVPLSPPPSFPFLLFYFIYLFIFPGVCSFYFHWASGLSETGAIVGGWARGGSWLGCGLVGLWVFFRLGVYCDCSPLAHGHLASTCDAVVKPFIHIIHDD